MSDVPAVHVARLAGMRERARTIAEAGGLAAALRQSRIPTRIDTTLSEGLVLGLLKQGVRKYLAIFGHGSTDLGEVLRVYEEAGVTRTYNFRNEVAMAHAATTLKWQYGETPAVVTSIGPGALQAMAGSLAAASNGVGVYHVYGDETTHGEGPNMQAIPKHPGLSVVHVPVYRGPHPLGGLGAYGAWNVGNWCAEVQARYHALEI